MCACAQIVFYTGREHSEDIQLAGSRILSYVYRQVKYRHNYRGLLYSEHVELGYLMFWSFTELNYQNTVGT